MNTNHPSSEDLKILNDFLGAFDIAAQAHARIPLSDTQTRELESLARGELSADERRSMVPLLAKNEVAMEILARLLKEER